jgi:hypothetical protein
VIVEAAQRVDAMPARQQSEKEARTETHAGTVRAIIVL